MRTDYDRDGAAHAQARAATSSVRILSRPELSLLIALPTVRVATMALWFLFNDDRDFALIALAVLAIILASTLLGAGAA